MVIGQEIDRVMRTFGKALSSKQQKEVLNQTLQQCEYYSWACSKAVKLVPMRSILMGIILGHEREMQSIGQDLEIVRVKRKMENDESSQ
jgi:hypothetical protein